MNTEGAGWGHCKGTCSLSLTGLGDQGRFLRLGRKEIPILSSIYGMQSPRDVSALAWVILGDSPSGASLRVDHP